MGELEAEGCLEPTRLESGFQPQTSESSVG